MASAHAAKPTETLSRWTANHDAELTGDAFERKMVGGRTRRVAITMDSNERILKDLERFALGMPGWYVPFRAPYSGSVECVVKVNATIPVRHQTRCRSETHGEDTH